MYFAVVILTMLVFPVASIIAEHWLAASPADLVTLAGKWFVFWGVGVRLLLAGLRQFFQPAFTAREIFGLTGDDGLLIVQELGIANFAVGIVALTSLIQPTFVVPVALNAAIFYGIAGFRHVAERHRSANENLAMASDLFIFVLLAAFVVAKWRFAV